MQLFQKTTIEVAQGLLGQVLVHNSAEGTTAGIIVETEAYLQDDPACHAYRRKTDRNAPMFGAAGTIYVYQIYGMHFCVNIATNQENIGEAVLIRALEPTQGIELMQQRRQSHLLKNLCSGPGKLVQAMGIHKGMNHWVINEEALSLENPKTEILPTDIFITTRIGLTVGTELQYRFYLKNSPFVSKR
jgi:DNA-3-methyladenine glycosylase